VGIVNEKCDPKPFLSAVQKLMIVDAEFRLNLHIDFVGQVHSHVRDFVRVSAELSGVTTFTPSVPHQELISMYGKSSLLILILTGYKDAEGYLPGKLFEYLATGLPVLGTGPAHGDAAELLFNTGAGEMIEGIEEEKIKMKIMEHFSVWRRGEGKTQRRDVQKYSRKSITRELIELF
jgi:glycosyltransferase involved in cell wall biosynthesis